LLQDEDGHFRDPALDDSQEPRLTPKGFQRKTTTTPTQPDEYDLPALRSFLCQEAYPYAADELERNGILFPALHAYADVNSNNTLLRAHRQMIRLQEMDSLMMNVQRQGRISFYMPCRGEEAIHMGTGSALHLQDPILAQYREQGLIMWRGFTLEQFANQVR
jgi:Dehydrogenase E1 component